MFSPSDKSNTNNQAYNSSGITVENVFAYLEQAKLLETGQDFWKAAENYVHSQQLLQALADEAARTAASGGDGVDVNEQLQISSLYSDKAEEYWSQSRLCLIRAMEQEKIKDEEDASKKVAVQATVATIKGTTPLTCHLIEDDEARSRNETFSVLFSRPVADVAMETSSGKDESLWDQQMSIEERLQNLNKSLPSGFKTDDERMDEINKGLNKLGLSLYTQKQPFSRFLDEVPKSDDEQIEEIIAQAKDQEAFDKVAGTKNEASLFVAQSTEEEDVDLSDDDNSKDEEPGDERLEDDQLAIKAIRKSVVNAQRKIAELVALLDEAKTAADKQYKDDDESSEDGIGWTTKLLVPAKSKLNSAQRDLRKAMEVWNEAVWVVKPKHKSVAVIDSNFENTAGVDDNSDEEAPDLIALIDEINETQKNDIENETNTPVNAKEMAAAAKDPISALPPCPVTILSGFLGSGKTTLIHYILKSPDHGKRIAVIENEFGEGLEVESLIARDGVDPQLDSLQDFIELPNGCICCTVKDSLVATLENLLEKRQDLDYILIEASGMANPGPIASVFWLDDALESRLRLDGIVTLVDAVHILEQLESTEEAAQQIGYADRIVLNKVDLLKQQPNTVDNIEQRLHELNPTALILRTSFSKISNLDWILNADCFGGVDRLDVLNRVWEKPEQAKLESSVHGSHDHSHKHHSEDDVNLCDLCNNSNDQLKGQHQHTTTIKTVSLQEEGSVDISKLNAWLADILWPNQDEKNEVLTAMLCDSETTQEKNPPRQSQDGCVQQLFRIKGIVSALFREEDEEDERIRGNYKLNMSGLDRRRFILQAVYDLWEVYPAGDDYVFQEEEDRVCKLVFIGKYLNEAELRSGFRRCFLKE